MGEGTVIVPRFYFKKVRAIAFCMDDYRYNCFVSSCCSSSCSYCSCIRSCSRSCSCSCSCFSSCSCCSSSSSSSSSFFVCFFFFFSKQKPILLFFYFEKKNVDIVFLVIVGICMNCWSTWRADMFYSSKGNHSKIWAFISLFGFNQLKQ